MTSPAHLGPYAVIDVALLPGVAEAIPATPTSPACIAVSARRADETTGDRAVLALVDPDLAGATDRIRVAPLAAVLTGTLGDCQACVIVAPVSDARWSWIFAGAPLPVRLANYVWHVVAGPDAPPAETWRWFRADVAGDLVRRGRARSPLAAREHPSAAELAADTEPTFTNPDRSTNPNNPNR